MSATFSVNASALSIVSGDENPFYVPMNVGRSSKDPSDRLLEQSVAFPFKPVEPAPVLKVANYNLK